MIHATGTFVWETSKASTETDKEFVGDTQEHVIRLAQSWFTRETNKLRDQSTPVTYMSFTLKFN